MTAGLALVATRSPGKLRELRPILHSAGIEIIDLAALGLGETPDEEAIEAHDSFEENAAAKARWFFERTGMATFADDSGLEVAALDGAPGVRSKRWSGRTDLTGHELDAANNRKLVDALRGKNDRAARYVCVAAYADAAGTVCARGTTAGRIIDIPRGDGGFGYDPHFESTELGMTFGEASLADKERVSHRGRAFRALIDRLRRERRAIGAVANHGRAG